MKDTLGGRMSTKTERRGGGRGLTKTDFASDIPMRDRILATCLLLFAEKGLAGISMRDIASAIGVNVGTVYHYFPTKQALYGTIVHGALEQQSWLYIEALSGPADAAMRMRAMWAILINSIIERDPKRQLLDRAYAETPETVGGFGASPVLDELKRAITATLDQLSPGAKELNWGKIAGVVFGIPHGLLRMNGVHSSYAQSWAGMTVEELSEVLIKMVTAAAAQLVEQQRQASA